MPCWKWKITAPAFRPLHCHTSLSGFIAWIKRGPASSESAGLGLSIVKSICIAHGAEVEAHSTAGSGSCFRVKIPLSKN